MISVNGLSFERRADGAVLVRKYTDARASRCIFEDVVSCEDFEKIVAALDDELLEISTAIEEHALELAPAAVINDVRIAADRAKRASEPAPHLEGVSPASVVAMVEAERVARAKEIADETAKYEALQKEAADKALADAKAAADKDAEAIARITGAVDELVRIGGAPAKVAMRRAPSEKVAEFVKSRGLTVLVDDLAPDGEYFVMPDGSGPASAATPTNVAEPVAGSEAGSAGAAPEVAKA